MIFVFSGKGQKYVLLIFQWLSVFSVQAKKEKKNIERKIVSFSNTKTKLHVFVVTIYKPRIQQVKYMTLLLESAHGTTI